MSWQPKSQSASTRRHFKFQHKTKIVRENSYLREPESTKATKSSSHAHWLWLLLPFLIVGLFYYASGLSINQLIIPETKNIDRAEIEEIFKAQKKTPALLVLDQSNLLIFNSSQFLATLQSRYQFHSIALRKNFRTHNLELTFNEKDYDLVWQEGEEYYFINYAGDIIISKNKNSTSTLGDLLSLLNTGTSKKQERRIEIDEKYLRSASNLNEALKNQARGLSNRRLAIGNEYNTLQVLILNGPIIYFDINSSLDTQLAKLEALRKNNLADGQVFNQQKYIDLRYGKSIFYQ